MNNVRKAVIPAAGFGTRFLPATKAVPKEMLPIVDTPTLQIIIEEAVKSGITEILIILGRNKKCIEDHFDRVIELEELLKRAGKSEYLNMVQDISNMAHIHYVRQKDMLGSANAVLEAEAFVGNEPFAVLFGDDIVYTQKTPCLKQLVTAFETTGKSIVGVQEVTEQDASKYGIIVPGESKGRYTELKGIKEKPAINELPSKLASMGRFVFTPAIFDYIKTTKMHSNGEYYLTDSIEAMAKVDGVFAYTFEGRRYDVGDKLGFIEANVEYALRDENLREGVAEYLKKIAKTL